MRIVSSPRLACTALFVLSLLLRLAQAVLHSFDGLYGQDAYAYYEYARELFAAIVGGQAPPAFWWPLGYPALLSSTFAVGGANIAAAQAITILCGTLVAPLAFLLALETAPREDKWAAAWVAGLLCAVSGQLVQSSVVIMADAPGLMWTTLGAWLLMRYARTSKTWTLAFAAVAMGLGVWTRWQNLIVAGVWFVTLAVIELTRAKAGAGVRARGRRWLPLVTAGVIFGSVLLPQMLIRSATDAPLAGQSWLEGWSITNFTARSFDTIDGHFVYPLPVALFYGQVFWHPAYLVLLLTPLFLVGVWALTRRSPGTERGGAILLLGWTGGMFLFLAGIPYENFRFGLGLFVPVAVVTGIGAGWVWNRWREKWTRYALLALVAGGLLVMVVWQPRVMAPVLESKTRELAQARWLEGNLPSDATLWTMGIDGAVQTYSSLRVKNLWNKSDEQVRGNPSAYLFIDVSNFETQWKGRQPEMLYAALRDAGALETVGEAQGWTLFRIK